MDLRGVQSEEQYLTIMKPEEYFKEPLLPDQRNYEALKAFYSDGIGAKETAEQFGLAIKREHHDREQT